MKKNHYFRRFWPVYAAASVIVLCFTLFASKSVTTIAQNMPIDDRVVIVIDPGHGGEDGGAVSCTGALESHINLQISLRLRDLCHLLGLKTRMIRTTDIAVYTQGKTIAEKKASDLRQRVDMVRQTEGAVLVSIHQNTFPESRYSGAQVFYAKTEGSKFLAESMQNHLVATLKPDSTRKAKPAENIYLLQHINCPAILIECGFLSNPQEEAQLRNLQYQQKICCVIVCALSQYINA